MGVYRCAECVCVCVRTGAALASGGEKVNVFGGRGVCVCVRCLRTFILVHRCAHVRLCESVFV